MLTNMKVISFFIITINMSWFIAAIHTCIIAHVEGNILGT